MKLLLDEMWSSDIAVQLRRRGHDVDAVAERPELRGKADSFLRHDVHIVGQVVTALEQLLNAELDLRNAEHWLQRAI